MHEIRAPGLLLRTPSPARALRLGAIAFGIGLMMTTGVACAGSDDEDSRSFSEKIIDNIKAGFSTTNMESKGIDYRERSPLVVPPRLDLPPPAAATGDANAPNWPRDPDEKRRKAAVAARQKVLTNSHHELSPAEAEAARASSNVPEPPPQGFTEKLNTYFGGTKPEVGQFKGEPTRETLTQPPPGYQIPSPNYAYGVGQKERRNRDKDADNKDASSKDAGNKDSKQSSNKP